MFASGPAFFVDPTDTYFEPSGQFRRCQDVLRIECVCGTHLFACNGLAPQFLSD